MNHQTAVQTHQKAPTPLLAGGILQRKCDCGQHTIAGGECNTCSRERETVQRRFATDNRSPDIEGKTLGSSSRTRSATPNFFAESRLARDFSRVQAFSLPSRNVHGAGGGNEPGAAEVDAPPPAAPPGAVGVVNAEPPAAIAPEAPKVPGGPAAGPAAPALSWSHLLRHKNDALWFFCGAHPSGFSTDARLRAAGFANPALLNWRITNGADKVMITGAAVGDGITVESKAGSTHRDDVFVEVTEGAGPAAPSFTGHLTVLRPSRLIHRGADTDHGACPGWAACGVGCSAYWTEIGYRVVDNMSGTIVGATVNENFPGAKTNDQVNNWGNPAAFITVPFWANTNGTFVDNWFQSCGNPAPVAPGSANAGTGVDRIPHEFYVGSQTPALGCRVQTHTAHRYLGFARHEGVTSPAP